MEIMGNCFDNYLIMVEVIFQEEYENCWLQPPSSENLVSSLDFVQDVCAMSPWSKEYCSGRFSQYWMCYRPNN